jgi:hypothetical protein
VTVIACDLAHAFVVARLLRIHCCTPALAFSLDSRFSILDLDLNFSFKSASFHSASRPVRGVPPFKGDLTCLKDRARHDLLRPIHDLSPICTIRYAYKPSLLPSIVPFVSPLPQCYLFLRIISVAKEPRGSVSTVVVERIRIRSPTRGCRDSRQQIHSLHMSRFSQQLCLTRVSRSLRSRLVHH